MAKNRDNRPELDYEELRELHERYRSRTRPARSPAAREESPQPDASDAVRRDPESLAEAAAEPLEAIDDRFDEEPLDDFPEEPRRRASREERDSDEDADEEPVNPNPFGSILSFLSKVKGKVGGRLGRRADGGEYEEYDADDEFADSSEADLTPLDEADEEPEEAKPAAKPAAKIPEAPKDVPTDAFDMPEDDAPPLIKRAAYEDDEDDEEGYEEDDGEESPSGGKLARFLSLFITRADEEIGAEGEADEGEDEAFGAPLFPEDDVAAVDAGGEKSMQEPRKVSTEMTELMAAGLGERTLSRKERRELEMRRQEVAASAQPISVPAPVQPTPVAVPAQRASVPAAQGVDEPTREFRPISRAGSAPAPVQEPASLFDDEEDEEFDQPLSKREQKKAERLRRKEAKKAAYDDEDEDDYEDDEEEAPAPEPKREKKPARRSRYDEDEYEDEEDDYEDDDDYDDDYEPKKRRGRRGSRRDDYDDYDDYEDDYDDEDSPSFGRYLLGFFKTLLLIVLILAVVILGLNVLHATGKTTIVTQMQGSVREWAPDVFDALFPCVSIEQKAEEPADAVQPTVEQPAVEQPAVEQQPASNNGVIAPAPVTPVN